MVISLFAMWAAAASLVPLQQGGGMRQQDENVAQSIENAVNSYLDVRENKGIVTPGDFNEWQLELKAGQVVIADARSEAIDPALEIVGADGSVLASNDDRFPGDQRPLLLWRCGADGKYGVRVRSYQDKAGGQAISRFKVFESFDLAATPTERWFESSADVLFRVPLQKGQIKQIYFEAPDGWYAVPPLMATISPLGLPSVPLTKPFYATIQGTVMAPVEGDYYVLSHVRLHERRKIRAAARPIVPAKLTSAEGFHSASAPAALPSLWTLPVKAGDFIEVSTPGLNLGSHIVVADEPSVEKFDLGKPDANPFFPPPPNQPPAPGPSLVQLPGRARDPRIAVYYATRDANLWIASNGAGAGDKPYDLFVRPAAKQFAAGAPLAGRLRIGKTDYWEFDAKVGDVMTFAFGAEAFAHKVTVRQPGLGIRWEKAAGPDESASEWSMVTDKPGKYIVGVSSLGDGGGGEYSVARKVFLPKEFGKGRPAVGTNSDGQTKVWKFDAKPNEPLYIHWKSKGYTATVRDETGAWANLNLTRIDDENSFGILKVDKPTSFLIVLAPSEKEGKYAIALSDLPGYPAGKS